MAERFGSWVRRVVDRSSKTRNGQIFGKDVFAELAGWASSTFRHHCTKWENWETPKYPRQEALQQRHSDLQRIFDKEDLISIIQHFAKADENFARRLIVNYQKWTTDGRRQDLAEWLAQAEEVGEEAEEAGESMEMDVDVQFVQSDIEMEMEVEVVTRQVQGPPAVEIVPSDDVEMEVEAPVNLNERQAENVKMDQRFVQDWEEVTSRHYTPDKKMVYAAPVIADFFFDGNVRKATKNLDKWRTRKNDSPCPQTGDREESGGQADAQGQVRVSLTSQEDEKAPSIFVRVANPNNSKGNTEILACKPLDLKEFILQSPAARRFGLTKLATNTLVRKLGGDPSLHAEIDANAQASKGTSIHTLARSPEVGSSAAITPSVPRQYLSQASEAYVYIAPGNGFIKIGETTNLLSRNNSLTDCDIMYALRITCPNPSGMAKCLECSIQSAYNVAIIKGKKDYFALEPLAQEMGQSTPDTNSLSWHMFTKAIEFLESLHVEARHVSLVQRKGRQFIPMSKDEFGGLQAHFESASPMGTVTPWVFSAASTPVPVEVQVEMIRCQRDIEVEKVKHSTQEDVEMEEARSKTEEFRAQAEQYRASAAKYAFFQAYVQGGHDPRNLPL